MQKHFEGELKVKEIERQKLNLEIINKEEDVELYKQQNENLRGENQNLKEDVELITKQKETLNNEYRKLEILIQSKDELIRTKDDQIIAVGEKFEELKSFCTNTLNNRKDNLDEKEKLKMQKMYIANVKLEGKIALIEKENRKLHEKCTDMEKQSEDKDKIINISRDQILDLQSQLKEEQLKSSILDKRTKDLKEHLDNKVVKVIKIESSITKHIDVLNVERKKMEFQLAERDEEMCLKRKEILGLQRILEEEHTKSSSREGLTFLESQSKINAQINALKEERQINEYQTVEIQAKDDLLRAKDSEILDVRKKFKELQSFCMKTLNGKNDILDTDLKEETGHIDTEVQKNEDVDFLRKHPLLYKILEENNDNIVKNQSDILNKEYENMEKEIKAKNELLKMKEAEILVVEKKFEELQSFCMERLNRRQANEDENMTEELKMKDLEIKNLELEIVEKCNAEEIKCSSLLFSLKKKDDLIISKNEEIIDLQKNVKEKEEEISSLKIDLREKLKNKEDELVEIELRSSDQMKVLNEQHEEIEAQLAERAAALIEKEEAVLSKDKEISNLQNILEEKQFQSSSAKAKSIDLEEKLKNKDAESETVKSEMISKRNECSKIKAKLSVKDDELCEMSEMVLEKDQKIKAVQISLEEVRLKFQLEFQKIVAGKDKAIKELEERITEKVNETVTSNTKQVKDEETNSEEKFKIYDQTHSDKRNTEIVKALESNNSRLVQEVSTLKTQLLSMNYNTNKFVVKAEAEDARISRQKTESLRNKILDLASDNSKLKLTLSLQSRNLEDTARDRDYFKTICKGTKNQIS